MNCIAILVIAVGIGLVCGLAFGFVAAILIFIIKAFSGHR